MAAFLAREDGPPAVECVVVLSGTVVVRRVAITALGTTASKTFTGVAATMGGS